MIHPVLRGRAAFHLFEDVGKMGGRNEPCRFADFGYALVCADELLLRVLAPDMMMINQRCVSRMAFERPEQIAAIDKQRVGHLLQGEFVRPVLLHVSNRGVCQRFAAGFLSDGHEGAFPVFFQTGTFFLYDRSSPND